MSAAAFAVRQRAAEAQFSATESKLALLRHLERMVQQGKADPSLLETAQRLAASGPGTEVVRKRAEHVFEYRPGVTPTPSASDARRFALGTQFSLGRTRWEVDGASIFSVADGKRLASTPAPHVTGWEAARARKIALAAQESPQLAGLRLLPQFTPGRAFFWGTIFAVWGTAALVAGGARSLGIQSAEDAPARLSAIVQPWGVALEARLAPLRERLSGSSEDGASSALGGVRSSAVVASLRAALLGQH